MDLYLVRHTSAADPHGYAQDADRPLTETGRIEAEPVAGAMLALGWQPELVLMSEISKGTLAHLQVDRPLRKRRAVLRALLPLRIATPLG